MKFRVVLKISYYEAHFDFDSADEATKFATTALTHGVATEDTKKPLVVQMLIAENFKNGDDE